MIIRQISAAEEIDICDKYKRCVPLKEIKRDHGLSNHRINKILKKNQIPFRPLGSWAKRYSHDETFFKKIDTEEKAYWLGFLYADGCIAEYSVNLSLHQIDIDSLKKFKNSLKFTGPIELRKDFVDYGDKYGTIISPTAKVRINSMALRQDLIALGCMPRKTFLLKFPTEEMVPSNLIHHFIRGYFDGDGSVFERKYKRKDGKVRGHASITSTKHMINGIVNTMIKKCGVKPESIHVRPHPTSDGISILLFASFPSMYAFKNFIYTDSHIHMNRKYEKFNSLYLEKVTFQIDRIKEQMMNDLLSGPESREVSFENFVSRGYPDHTLKLALLRLEREGKLVGRMDGKRKKYLLKK